MFRGIHTITVDAKSRFAIPMCYREALKSDLVITIDPKDTCLLLYPLDNWLIIEEQLQQLPSFDPTARRIQRLLIGYATDISLDSNGRVLIPSLLKDRAEINKNLVMIGQGNKFELWDEKVWHSNTQEWLAEEASQEQGLPDKMKHFSL